jgi:hypothetical protein
MRSPSFSLFSSSNTTRNSPRANASTASSIESNWKSSAERTGGLDTSFGRQPVMGFGGRHAVPFEVDAIGSLKLDGTRVRTDAFSDGGSGTGETDSTATGAIEGFRVEDMTERGSAQGLVDRIPSRFIVLRGGGKELRGGQRSVSMLMLGLVPENLHDKSRPDQSRKVHVAFSANLQVQFLPARPFASLYILVKYRADVESIYSELCGCWGVRMKAASHSYPSSCLAGCSPNRKPLGKPVKLRNKQTRYYGSRRSWNCRGSRWQRRWTP